MTHVRGRGNCMDDSILNTIKILIGIEADDTAFDMNIIVLINSAIMTLRQLGIGPPNGFTISDSSSKWFDYIPDINTYESVKEYIHLKVALIFDPPTSSYVLEEMKRQLLEIEWRLKIEKEEIEQEK